MRNGCAGGSVSSTLDVDRDTFSDAAPPWRLIMFRPAPHRAYSCSVERDKGNGWGSAGDALVPGPSIHAV